MRNIEEIFSQVASTPDFSGHTVTSVDYRNAYGDTPLHIVCNWGDIEAIEVLISAGANVNAVGESGFTPLHCTAEQNHPAAIEKLLECGAIQIRSNDGQTPLELAEMLRNIEAIDVFARHI